MKVQDKDMGKQFMIQVWQLIFYKTPKALETKAKIDEWDYKKSRCFCKAEEETELSDHLQTGGKTADCSSDKELISKI